MARRALPLAVSAASRVDARRDFGAIRFLVWTYFWLLLGEGALRKWVAPQISDLLLLIRDPVALLMIALAIQAGILPLVGAMQRLVLLLVLFCFVAVVQTVVGTQTTPMVVLFGLRTYFLHIPVIFITGRVLRFKDVQKMGLVILLLSIPMALLMAAQFRSSPDSLLNTGAGAGTSRQIGTALGKIRPAGTFSFISGPILFYQLVLALVLGAIVHRRYLPRWVCYLAVIGLLLAAAVSGSRSFIAGWAAVVAAFLLATNVRGQFMSKAIQTICIVVLTFAALTWTDTFTEGLEVLNARFEEAGSLEGGLGAGNRVVSLIADPFSTLFLAPLFGYGLGLGTNVGAALLTGESQFLLAESEWSRVLLEAGPLAGGLFLLFRFSIAYRLGKFSWRAARSGNTLPLLFFGASVVGLLLGQWGQSTTLGFAIFGGGLCLASANRPSGTQRRAQSMGGPRIRFPARVPA